MDNTEFASIFKVPRQSFGKVSIALMETKYLSNTSKIRKKVYRLGRGDCGSFFLFEPNSGVAYK